jgi:hypothetical protein
MDNLIRTLPTLLRAIDSHEVVEAAAIAAWKHAAGDGLRDHAVPLRLEERTLIVAVADGVWQKQLSSLCAQMVFRVNNLLGRSLVDRTDLRIEPDAVKHRPTAPKAVTQVEENDVPIELWSAARAISDKDLRQTFLRAALSSTKRNESRKTG